MSNNVAVEFTIGQRQAVETEFTINASPTKVSQLENDLDFQTKEEVDTALEGKQDTLTAGEGISIENNVISATDTSTEWGLITGDIDDQTDLKDALDAKQDVISDLSEIRSGAEKGETALQPNDNISELTNDAGYITGITSSDVTTALGYTPYNSSNPSGYQTENQVANSIATETTNRENADNSLQSQIDAIVASSDVFDIVGTYAELQAYDISTVPVNDIIKVLVDSTHSNAATYYRCVETGGVKSWSYIGSEGAYYTKAEADAAFVPQTRTVNSKALSQNITLTASDVGADASGSASTAETNAKNYADSLASNYATAAQGALADTAVQPADLATVATTGDYDDLIDKPTIPTVNDATLTIQKNGVDVQTFTANASTNATANITVPTDTSDLTNGAGFITSSDLPTNYVTTNTAQDISGRKTFLGEKAIYFKQSASSNKLGFTLYNTSSTEIGAFEYRPNTIGSGALLNVNCSSTGGDYVGFRYWGTAVNIVAPKVATAGTYYIPVKVTDGNTTVTASSAGTVDISSLLPTVNNPTITITQGGVTKGSFTLNQASGDTIALDAGGGGGGSYTAGTGIDITSNVISVTSPTLTNTATGSNSLTIVGTANAGADGINIGSSSKGGRSCVVIGNNSTTGLLGSYNVAIGYYSEASANVGYSVALGNEAKTSAQYAIQLGQGTNSEANSFYVATSSSNNWKLLGNDGLIPAARIPISTSVDSTSTNSTVVGAKLFYDTCGDIESAINTIRGV